MTGKELLKELKAAAEALGMPIKEKSFRNIGIPVKSGYCKVNEEDVFLLDRNMSVADKNRVIKEILRQRYPEGPAGFIESDELDKSSPTEKPRISDELKRRIWPKK